MVQFMSSSAGTGQNSNHVVGRLIVREHDRSAGGIRAILNPATHGCRKVDCIIYVWLYAGLRILTLLL